MGLTRQPSIGLKFNRLPWKKVIFYRQSLKKVVFQLIFMDFWLLKNL